MNYLTEIVSAFCVVCVFVGSLYMLCPDGKLSKSIKYVLSLVFLVSVMMIAGMGKGKINFDFNLNQVVTEISSALIGSIAIVICVPITAIVASELIKRIPQNIDVISIEETNH